jgi:hypothetical protein
LVAVVAALVILPATVRAYEVYQHGGIDDCETCHENAHTDRTPTSDACSTCHSGYQIVRAGETCWTCHTPGQDMRWARSDVSCLSACHLRGGVDFAHGVHAGATPACSTCHTPTRSAAESGGSAHHTVPAPVLDLVAPAAAAPGSSVTLTGAKLTWAALVRFGGVDAVFIIASDTSITAVVPAAAKAGPVTVHSAGGEATAAFTVLPPDQPTSAAITLAASRRVLTLGRRVQLAGCLTPAGSVAPARMVVQRRVSGAWRTAASTLRTPGASGDFVWSYRPQRAGAYRARAAAAGAASSWVAFRVR